MGDDPKTRSSRETHEDLDLIRELETLRRERARWQRLGEINKALNSDLQAKNLLDRIMDAALEFSGAVRGFLVLKQPDGNFSFVVARKLDHQIIHRPEFQVSYSIIQTVIESAQPIRIDDASQDAKFRESTSVRDLRLICILCVPLSSKGQTIGALYVESKNAFTPFREEHQEILLAFADQAALAIANASRIEALQSSVASLRQAVRKPPGFEEIVGHSKGLLEALQLSSQAAATDLPVLIEGETGTGKELVARAIHQGGSRRDAPFLAVNCAAIPETLQESEFFGHEKGAFTGATSSRKGKFELASGGTLFLDEVGELDGSLQVKLLRALDQGEIQKLGAPKPISVNVRVIAASNRELEKRISEGLFRQDLFYRLNTMRIHLPALRERKEDIPFLADYFLHQQAHKVGKKLHGFRPWAMRALVNHEYSGNVRELENAIRYAAVVCQDERIWLEDLPKQFQQATQQAAPAILDIPTTHEELNRAKERARLELEKLFVLHVLRKTGGNISEAARQTGIHRTQLQEMVTRHQINPDLFEHPSGQSDPS